jgi:hypothetical protein
MSNNGKICIYSGRVVSRSRDALLGWKDIFVGGRVTSATRVDRLKPVPKQQKGD